MKVKTQWLHRPDLVANLLVRFGPIQIWTCPIHRLHFHWWPMLAEGKHEERRRIRQDTLLELVDKLNKSGARVDEHFPDVLRIISEMY